ncbi:MAG: sulfurtransferase [Ferruginibacter sp.]
MENKISPVIAPADLVALWKTTAIVLVDARAGAEAGAQYETRHLEGALFVDLELQLAHKKTDAANGGRHPLPDPARFAAVLNELGIRPDSHVIIYDDKNGSNAAARFWWMLKAAGHALVQVVDGGLDAAFAAGFPTRAGKETAAPAGDYEIKKWQLSLAAIDEVEKARQSPGYLVIDVRDAVRFRGEKEPIDLVAGHIPGAINIPFTGNLDEQGFFLSTAELKQKYSAALENREPENVIVHCGSGVTACHTLLAIAQAGMEIPTLYVGSWSEWSRNDKPIGTGE